MATSILPPGDLGANALRDPPDVAADVTLVPDPHRSVIPKSYRRTGIPKERHVADSNENKETVLAFYSLAFNERQPAEAVAEYVGSTYRQHNPQAHDGPVGFIQFVLGLFGQFPDASLEIKRAVAEGDLVITHSLMRTGPQDRGTAVADIFRLENGKVVEHWDVLQPVPETSVNDNTMF
jgi:predicted SnoaL-like aldol condensation-catalyzing enzyme